MASKKAVKFAISALAAAGIAIFLYFWNPQDIAWFPRCPFYAATGLKCPGCGTLRGIHALLHLRFMDAIRLNALMVASIPLLAAMIAFPKVRYSVLGAKTILFIVLAWWLLRNIIV